MTEWTNVDKSGSSGPDTRINKGALLVWRCIAPVTMGSNPIARFKIKGETAKMKKEICYCDGENCGNYAPVLEEFKGKHFCSECMIWEKATLDQRTEILKKKINALR